MKTNGVLKMLLGVVSLVALNSTAKVDFVPIQEKAQGRSLTGATLINDSLYSNPASSSFLSTYSVDGSYFLPKSFAVSVVDTRTSAVGGGLGYYRNVPTGSNWVDQGARLAFTSKVASNVGVGVTGKITWGHSPVGISEKSYDIDSGVLSQFGFLQVGMVMKNILGGNAILGETREWSLGARLNYQQILFFAATAHGKAWSLNPDYYGLGVEYITPYFISLKAGLRILPYEVANNRWSSGVSFLGPKFSIHYAVLFAQDEATSTEHSLGVTVPL